MKYLMILAALLGCCVPLPGCVSMKDMQGVTGRISASAEGDNPEVIAEYYMAWGVRLNTKNVTLKADADKTLEGKEPGG